MQLIINPVSYRRVSTKPEVMPVVGIRNNKFSWIINLAAILKIPQLELSNRTGDRLF